MACIRAKSCSLVSSGLGNKFLCPKPSADRHCLISSLGFNLQRTTSVSFPPMSRPLGCPWDPALTGIYRCPRWTRQPQPRRRLQRLSACQLRVDAEQIWWPILPRTMFYSRVNRGSWKTVPIGFAHIPWTLTYYRVE